MFAELTSGGSVVYLRANNNLGCRDIKHASAYRVRSLQTPAVSLVHPFEYLFPRSRKCVFAGCRAHGCQQIRTVHQHRRVTREIMAFLADESRPAVLHREFRTAASTD